MISATIADRHLGRGASAEVEPDRRVQALQLFWCGTGVVERLGTIRRGAPAAQRADVADICRERLDDGR